MWKKGENIILQPPVLSERLIVQVSLDKGWFTCVFFSVGNTSASSRGGGGRGGYTTKTSQILSIPLFYSAFHFTLIKSWKMMRFGGFGGVIYSNLIGQNVPYFGRSIKAKKPFGTRISRLWMIWLPKKRVWELLFSNQFCYRGKHKTRHFSFTQRFVQRTVRAVLALYVSAKPRVCRKRHFNSAKLKAGLGLGKDHVLSPWTRG